MKLFINALSHLDVSLWSPVQGLTGASWWVDLELDAPQGEDGMILDFGRVKPWVKQFLDGGADHTLLLPTQSDALEIIELDNQRLRVVSQSPYTLNVEGPREAFTLLPMASISDEALAQWLTGQLNERLPVHNGKALLYLRQENLAGAAEIHYSHGLRLHDGNCQRIAHGHRSKIEVFCDGKPAPEAASDLASQWNHAYLYDQADFLYQHDDQITLGYAAPQGVFQLTLPQSVTCKLPGPTTVENLAGFLLKQMRQKHPEHQWQIRMYEGINKGAIAG
ncbi:MAG: 6-carboxytetrahydropterin synthase [Marinospirillum sp.]|uniref:6-carboxytetrahydropterin synthase n=1 Tax=Marinospirillum sp. TaxID=2183934 RepID=UPI001A064B67|nr:6-carboxytetrahydropterin synthase [Marinospirillum sp.]MBE0506078.1 6-carboxytetrahydropterin synthase [Marinospirillum sp.]